jgi:hypothetical protein
MESEDRRQSMRITSAQLLASRGRLRFACPHVRDMLTCWDAPCHDQLCGLRVSRMPLEEWKGGLVRSQVWLFSREAGSTLTHWCPSGPGGEVPGGLDKIA